MTTATCQRCGDDVELPTCPDCGSSALKCKRPSGHDAAEWHKARREAWSQLVCEGVAL